MLEFKVIEELIENYIYICKICFEDRLNNYIKFIIKSNRGI